MTSFLHIPKFNSLTMLNIVNCIASCHLGCYINVMFDLDYLFEIIQNSHWPISYESAYNPSNPCDQSLF